MLKWSGHKTKLRWNKNIYISVVMIFVCCMCDKYWTKYFLLILGTFSSNSFNSLVNTFHMPVWNILFTWDLIDLYIPSHKIYTDISFLYVLIEYDYEEMYFVMLCIHISYMDTWYPDELIFMCCKIILSSCLLIKLCAWIFLLFMNWHYMFIL